MKYRVAKKRRSRWWRALDLAHRQPSRKRLRAAAVACFLAHAAYAQLSRDDRVRLKVESTSRRAGKWGKAR